MQRQNTSSEIIETEVDELFEVKTYFFIGAYQQCLNEINKLRVRTLYPFHFLTKSLFPIIENVLTIFVLLLFDLIHIERQLFEKGLFYVACIHCSAQISRCFGWTL